MYFSYCNLGYFYIYIFFFFFVIIFFFSGPSLIAAFYAEEITLALQHVSSMVVDGDVDVAYLRTIN